MRADVPRATDALGGNARNGRASPRIRCRLGIRGPGIQACFDESKNIRRSIDTRLSRSSCTRVHLRVPRACTRNTHARVRVRVPNTRISGLTKIKAGSAECEQGRSIDINQFRK